MNNISGIAKSYAKAIVEISVDNKNTDLIESELKDIAAIITKDQGIWEFMVSPRVSKQAKDDSIDKSFAGKVHPSLVSLLHILVRNDRISIIEELTKQFTELNDLRKGIIRVEVHSATKLKENILSQIQAWCVASFRANQCKVIEVIKPELIGGMVIKYGDLVFDRSMRRKLNSLKSHIIGDMQTLLSAEKIGAYYEN
jgi:F-type H+-transporting ATPase subunit delta